MADTTKKKYVKGSAKSKIFDNGGENIYLSLYFPDLEKLEKNEDGYVRIVVSQNKEVDKYGNSHSVYENDWKPDPKYKKKVTPPGGNPVKKATPIDTKVSKDDLPF